MLPIGPLMMEHRLIERMIQTAKTELEKMQTQKTADCALIAEIVRFMRDYADRCHHGKEENILFRALGQKNISPDHRRTMEELLEEHRQGREVTLSLEEANRRYQDGDAAALAAIANDLRWLVEFYPRHIQKEDKRFFFPIMDYFTREEKDNLIAEGHASDSQLLHQEYRDLVKTFELKINPRSICPGSF